MASGGGATVRQLGSTSFDSSLCPSAAVTLHSLPDHELQRLSDEQLIAYIRDARTAGEFAAGDAR